MLIYYFYRWLAARPKSAAGSPAAAGAPVVASAAAMTQRMGVLSAAQVAATVLALYLVDRQHLLGTAQLVIPFVFALVVLLLVPDRGIVARLLHTRPLQWLGLHSYSIYLTHVTVLTVLDWLGRAVPEPAKHLVGLLYLALVFAMSMLTYRFVEAPWRERGKVLAARVESGDSFAREGDPSLPR